MFLVLTYSRDNEILESSNQSKSRKEKSKKYKNETIMIILRKERVHGSPPQYPQSIGRSDGVDG